MQISTQEKTMTSIEIANLTDKNHRHVLRDIRNMIDELEIDVPNFEHIYLDAYKREQTMFKLNRKLTDCLLTGYSAKARMMVIERWHELENIKPMTQMEMIASMSSGMVEIERQQLEQASLLSETTLRIDNELAELKEDIKSKIRIHDIRPQNTVTITGIKKGYDKVKPQGFSLEYVGNLVQDAIRSNSINVVSWVNLHPKAEGRKVEGAYLKEANRIIKNAWDIIEGEK